MEKEIFTLLLQKHIIGNLVESERKELTTFISKKQNKELITATMEELLLHETGTREFDEEHHRPLLNAILRAETVTDGAEHSSNLSTGRRSLLERIGFKRGPRH